MLMAILLVSGAVAGQGDRGATLLSDDTTFEVVATIAVPDAPHGICFSGDGRFAYVACEGNHTVSVIRTTTAPGPTPGPAKTEVVVLGMIHSGHRTSTHYDLDVVRDLVRAIDPDSICVEIPPNRFDRAAAEFRETGTITETRVRVFPEYVDVIFPLTRELDFRIVPTAGWTAQMNDYRRAALGRISRDPARASEWAEYQASMETMDRAIQAIDGEDDPRSIHRDEYDSIIRRGLGGPYDTYFNDDLADGGWDNINAKHYALIAAHLDRVRGRGQRVLITYGAAHKGWFLRMLRKRDDVMLLEVGPFLDEIDALK